jgi:hypothetical protein
MQNKSLLLPKGWGNDLLSEFQTKAFENELATYVHAPQWRQALLDVETVLHRCATHVIKKMLRTDDASAILLFLTAHNQYLASARSVSAGHCLATYPTGRAAVESALYSWYLSVNPEAAQRWNNKPTDRDELKRWRNEFKFASLTKNLHAIDKRAADWAKYLHQIAIDFGAHPNRDALYSNMKIEDGEDGAFTIKMMYLHQWDAFFISSAKFVVETGMIAIRLFSLGFPEDEKTLNLAQDQERLTTYLKHLLETTELEAQN